MQNGNDIMSFPFCIKVIFTSMLAGRSSLMLTIADRDLFSKSV